MIFGTTENRLGVVLENSNEESSIAGVEGSSQEIIIVVRHEAYPRLKS
jgi:hypothetical protein